MSIDPVTERQWWKRQDLSSLTETELEVVTLRFGLLDGSYPLLLKDVAAKLKKTGTWAKYVVDRARVKVDRAALEAAGTAMTCRYDEKIEITLEGILTFNPKAMLKKLKGAGVHTRAGLLDKSAEWLLGVGLQGIPLNDLRTHLARSSPPLYLRGELPTTPR